MDNQKCRILLADDDEDDRQFFTDAINSLPVATELTTVTNGDALLEYLHQSKENLPNLLFLDLNMPFRSGLDCLKQIRRNADLDAVIIVMYSTSGSEIDIDNTFKGGANSYIRKPHRFAALVNILHEVLTNNWQAPNENPTRESYLFSL